MFFTFVVFSLNTTIVCQQPNLGTCSLFGIFSAIGAIDNIGSTVIYGDVGTNAGAFNGFPPGIIYGNVHISDSVSAKAAIDVDLLYYYLLSLNCGSTIANNLGDGQILTANTYCVVDASTLNDTLFLDAQNNSDAIFIFKLNGAFNIGVNSVVKLVNHAQAKNIFWQVNGLFNLGDYSKFKGTVVTDGANSLLSNSEIEGRILSRAGAISLSNNAVLMNFNDSPLPIELLTFEAICYNNKALLKWQTASESNNDYFSIERSYDNQKWVFISKIDGAGNSTSLINYSYLISEFESKKLSYFRLKQTDFDGHYSYSNIVVLEICTLNTIEFNIFPNPTIHSIQINYSGELSNFISMKIYNSKGEIIDSFNYFQSEIDIKHYNSGTYYLKIEINDVLINEKFMVID